MSLLLVYILQELCIVLCYHSPAVQPLKRFFFSPLCHVHQSNSFPDISPRQTLQATSSSNV